MLYALLVGAALTLAALAAEQGARLGRRATRWGWALAMALTVCLPLLAQGDGERATAPPAAVGISDGAAGVLSACRHRWRPAACPSSHR